MYGPDKLTKPGIGLRIRCHISFLKTGLIAVLFVLLVIANRLNV